MEVQIPKKLNFLFEPYRYKVAYGGRAGGKSWSFARALLILGAQRKLRILCGREIQNSIKESVHKLLENQIQSLGLSGFYEVLQTEIRGKNGTEFLFSGLKHKIDSIKSLEDVDIVWVEEAQMVSNHTWDVLIPTIRKEGSEIWASFNPDLEADPTYQRFIVNPPESSKIVKINWNDNAFVTDVIRKEIKDLKERDPDSYLHVYEGHCRQALEGAVYADELREATEQNRITNVPYDKSRPVETFWDLGRADNTSIWFAQTTGSEFRIIDFYQNCRKHVSHYIQELQKRGYVYSHHFLPHDAKNEALEADRTVEGHVVNAFPNAQVTVLEKLSVRAGIEAVRSIFNQLWFDKIKCEEGLHALRHYRYRENRDGEFVDREPEHKWPSHAADALRYLAMSITLEEKQRKESMNINYRNMSNSWMN